MATTWSGWTADGEHPGSEFFSAGKFWDAEGRGRHPLAWGVPTLQNELGRPVMEYMYETLQPRARMSCRTFQSPPGLQTISNHGTNI